MGGFIVSQVAARHADRIDRLIYVAAMLPVDGNTIGGLSFEAGSSLDDVQQEFEDAGVDRDGPEIGSQPLLPLASGFDGGSEFDDLPKHYIRCEDDKILPLPFQNTMIGRVEGATVTTHDIETGHLPQITKPAELLSAILDEIS